MISPVRPGACRGPVCHSDAIGWVGRRPHREVSAARRAVPPRLGFRRRSIPVNPGRFRCFAVMPPDRCEPPTPGRGSRWPDGWHAGATTAGSSSSTFVTPPAGPASSRSCSARPTCSRPAHRLRAEFCVAVEGIVEIRPEGNANADIATGEIEVNATALTVLGESARRCRSSSTSPPARRPGCGTAIWTCGATAVPATHCGSAPGSTPPPARCWPATTSSRSRRPR